MFHKAVADASSWLYDPVALRVPWNESEYHLVSRGRAAERLCFAIMWDNGIVKPKPPYIRALEETKVALLVEGLEGQYLPFHSTSIVLLFYYNQ